VHACEREVLGGWLACLRARRSQRDHAQAEPTEVLAKIPNVGDLCEFFVPKDQ